jgi:hypothetical protein
MLNLPLKSVAVALLFSALLGPIGVLYSSMTGGIILILMGLLILRMKLWGLAIILWILCCIWGVAAANRYNKKIVRQK